jgi:hypothetical protein
MKNHSGLSIIATVMVMMILALFAAAAVSLVTSGSNIGLQEEQGDAAFYIADGGLQYAIKANNFPNFAVGSTNLGDGSFIVTVPTLSADITAATTGPITVSSTDGFILNPGDATNQYWIMLCGVTGNPTPDLTASNTCEKISFTGKTATTFTTGTRGRDSSSAVAHPATSVVLMYSWDTTKTTTIATRALARKDKCTTPDTTICVADTSPFADSGFIRINNSYADENNIEDVFYSGTGSGAAACDATCTGGTVGCLGTSGCTRRAYDGNKKGTVSHASGTNVYQSEITALPTSTGVISGLVLTGSIQRVVQGTVRPLY